jgi:D-glycero-D-manno-heptose 1,7-bisphosphate phosphatase
LNIKAVFLDRDGIINELVYFSEQGIVDSPFTPEQLRLTPFAVKAVNRFHELGYKVILISNQPGMAKAHFDEQTFYTISLRMRELLKEGNAYLDGEYYCFHHPNGVREEYRKVCDCRKPKPGLILRAAKDHNVSLARSFFVGDGPVDVKAGREAGCKTVLVASTNGLLLRLLTEQDAEPDYLVKTLEEAVRIVEDCVRLPHTT